MWLLAEVLGCGWLLVMVMAMVRRERDVVGWVEVGVHDLIGGCCLIEGR